MDLKVAAATFPKVAAATFFVEMHGGASGCQFKHKLKYVSNLFEIRVELNMTSV